MRTKSFALFAALLALMLVAAGGVYAYDESNSRRIAEGVTVSGVDVGGMTASAARDELRAALLEPLKEPVRVRYKGKRYQLSPAQARVGVDVDGSVDRALSRSREGNLVSRAYRDLTGGRVDADVPVDISYSKAAIRRLVNRVAEDLHEKPQDADIEISAGGVDPKPSKDGREVRKAELRRDIDEALLAVDGSKTVRVRTKTIKPKVTTAEVADKYPTILVVNRSAFKLTLYKNLKPAKSYGIAVGQVGLETPAGRYSIANKAVNPDWNVPNSDWAGDLAGTVVPGGTPQNPLKARWMGIYNGVGIHGTGDPGSIGTNASHGCIRMRVPEVIELYDEVPVGAPVYIA